MSTNSMMRFLVASVVIAGNAACDKERASGDATNATAGQPQLDTIGDTIVARSSGPGAWGDSIKLIEELRIGSADSGDAYGFGIVREVAVDRKGNIFVADLKAQNVRS